MPKIIKLVPNAILVVVGDGSMKDELIAQINNLSLQDRVFLVGAKNQSEVANFIKASSVVVLPSSAEAMSLACMEAMALERPVVVSSVGGLVDLVGINEERGLRFDIFKNHKSTYDAIDPLMIDDNKYLLMAKKI